MLALFTLLVLGYLVLPVLILVPLAFTSAHYLAFPPPGLSLQWFDRVVHDPNWLRALGVSTRIALAVAAVSTALALGAGVGLSRGPVRLRKPLFGLLIVPLIVPTIISTIAVYFAFARLHFVGNEWAVIAGQTLLALPIAIVLATAALQSFDVRIEQAALIHGASPLRAFWRVTVPNIAPGVIAAALFAFLNSFDEVLMALFLAGPRHQTLPVRIWNAVQFELDPSIAAVSVFVSLLALIVLLLAGRLQRQ